MTIRDGFSVDLARDLSTLSVCSSHPATSWLEYSTTFLFKKSSVTNHLFCPVVSTVVNITGRGGGWLHQITMMYDDANNTTLGGNNADLKANLPCAEGYSAMTVLRGEKFRQFRARYSGFMLYTEPIGMSNPNDVLKTLYFG